MNTPLLILCATQTGNAVALAVAASKRFRACGCAVRTKDMADVSPAILLEHGRLCAIASTWGDGDPPDEAAPFFEALRRSVLDLARLRFSIGALGDSSYEKFCGCGHELQSLREWRGACKFHPLTECDADFDATCAGGLEGSAAELPEIGAGVP